MRERLGIPVFVDNDAQRRGARRAPLRRRGGAPTNAVMLTIGTGIGGGLILDGQLYRGSTGAGAELGHMVIDDRRPALPGHLPEPRLRRVVASGTALGREGRAAAERAPRLGARPGAGRGEEVDGKVVTEAAIAGDEVAVEVIAGVGRPPRASALARSPTSSTPT